METVAFQRNLQRYYLRRFISPLPIYYRSQLTKCQFVEEESTLFNEFNWSNTDVFMKLSIDNNSSLEGQIETDCFLAY